MNNLQHSPWLDFKPLKVKVGVCEPLWEADNHEMQNCVQVKYAEIENFGGSLSIYVCACSSVRGM